MWWIKMKMSEKYIIDKKLERFKTSKFRSGFHLSNKDRKYVSDKGYKVIKSHAYDFICKRLAPYPTLNDGKQTPMRGHPVFIAQHATATCCRGCLYKWHKIKAGTNLSCEQIEYVVNVIMKWIIKEMNNDIPFKKK